MKITIKKLIIAATSIPTVETKIIKIIKINLVVTFNNYINNIMLSLSKLKQPF